MSVARSRWHKTLVSSQVGMRLGSKIFLTAALVIVVLAGVGFLSLRAVGRLVSVNREIATRTVPAVRLTASAREAIAPLPRLGVRAAVCLALLGTGVSARRMTRSLGLLSSATAEVAAGAFREPLAAEGPDEIGALARLFNRMTRQLGRQFSALSMRSEISVTLNQHQKLEEILQRCAEILVKHLDLALAGVWTLDGDAKTLELRASAGTCTDLHETHRRIPLGQAELGLIAA